MTRLDVSADLTVDVDGIRATLTGSGGRLVLASDDPGALWSAATALEPPAGGGRTAARALGHVADGLRESGVRLDVVGPRGSLVSLGADVRSRAGWLVTGSSALRPGELRALGPLMVSDLRVRRSARTAGVALVGVVLAGALIRRARSSGG